MRRSAPATTLSERRSRASAARVSTARRCVVGIASRPRGGESGDRLVDACHLATIGRPGLALLLVVQLDSERPFERVAPDRRFRCEAEVSTRARSSSDAAT
jgi:hypothetical protein